MPRIRFGRNSRRPAGLLAAAGILMAPLLTGCEARVAAEPVAAAETAPAAVVPVTVVSVPKTDAAPAEATIAAPAPVAPTPAELVAGHLAAGEFGRAEQVAASVAVPAERAVLFQKVAAAEVAAGETAAAGRVLERLTAEERAAFAAGLAGDPQLAGGAGQADFSQLMLLIQQTTAGPWFDIDGVGGTMAPFSSGVHVGPLGMMALLSKAEQTGRLRDLAASARTADLNADMAAAADMRVVSLTRLEKAVAESIAKGGEVPASMAHLAGLTRVQYVFLDETSGEILVAGPAEGWKYDAGLAVGAGSGRPTLLLDDLVTVLRTFSPSGANAFQCLIVPRQDGMKAVQEFAAASNARGSLSGSAGVRNFTDRLEALLGEQDVVVNGVPADSRVARVIVEADYRMKLIGIDEIEAAGLPSWFDLLSVGKDDAPVATKALRWWLTTNYDAVLHAGDKTAFEFVGPAVKCLSEDEFLTPEGERIHTGQAELTNKLFADRFTTGYEALATEDRVFAELRNVMDLAMVAAVIRAERLDARAGWDRGAFAEGGAYAGTTFPVAKTVATVANSRVYDGKEVVVQVAGGVTADLLAVLKDSAVYHEATRVRPASAAARPADLPAGRWWWDAK